ncbi:MAG: alpha/beta hydrolase [Cocleimonas sp.]
MKLLFASLFGLIVVLFVGCSSVKSTDLINFVLPAGGYDKKTLSYGNLPRQSLDLYTPKSKQSKKPILFVYGGAWRDGDKQDFEFVAHALTGLGHTVIIPEYRRYPEVQFPLFVNDIADSIRYMEHQALTVLGEPLDEVILMGHSAGAHTVALLTTDESYLKSRGIKTKISGLIAMSGPYDLDLKDPEVEPVFKNTTAKKTNPILNIRSDMSPVLLLHGAADKRVGPFNTERFASALSKSGVSVTTHIYPDVDHTKIIGSLAAPLRFLSDSYSDIKDFLVQIK